MTSITILKDILDYIKPTGSGGFEELTGIVFGTIIGVPMRLAASGLQFGIDGKSAYSSDNISYECKHYKTKITRDVVLSKLASLSITNTPPDLWILSATNSITSQLADEMQLFSERQGIPIIILDWSSINIPPLAIALAMAKKQVVEFFNTNFPTDIFHLQLDSALESIIKKDGFAEHSRKLQFNLQKFSLATTLAQQANHKWLKKTFENRRLATRNLNQPLAPNDANNFTLIRPQLNDQFNDFSTSNSDNSVLFILGGEGNGKSWLIAQSWLAMKRKPIMILFTPEELASPFVNLNITELLISKFIKQSGDCDNEIVRKRWQRLLKNRLNTDTDLVEILVVIDGLNQRPSIEWPKIINAFSYELEQLKAKLIITVRTAYYQNFIKDRVEINIAEINVTEWNNEERNTILSKNGIDYSKLSSSVATFLCNPRLLGITIRLLNSSEILNLEEISINRLLFEHIALIGQEHSEPSSNHEFNLKLRNHAKSIISRINQRQMDDLAIFEGGLDSVADGRFFVPLNEDPTRYTIEDSGLILALGLALIECLQKASRNNKDLFNTIEVAIEPISALDMTAQVLLAALMVSIVDTKQPDSFAHTLLCIYAKAQNPSDHDLNSFVSYVRQRPTVFTKSIYTLYTEQNNAPNIDWIISSLLHASQHNEIWEVISSEIKKWMSLYSLSPKRRALLHNSMTADEKDIELKVSRDRINNDIHKLSGFEQDFLKQLTPSKIYFEKLMRTALYLIAGKPIAPFAKSIVQLSFSLNLNSTSQSPRSERTDLIRYNRVDWSDARKELLKEVDIFRNEDTSKVGLWTVVGILDAISSQKESNEADYIFTELTKDRDRINWRRIEEYCSLDPCNPETVQPDNISKTAQQYSEIDVAKMRVSRFPDRESHFIRDASTGLARFNPQTLIIKYKEFIKNVLLRSNGPARWGLYNLRENTPLFTRTNALDLISRCEEGITCSTLKGLKKNEQWIFAQYHLIIAFPFLSGEEQFEVLKTIQPDKILTTVIPLLKPLSESFFAKNLKKYCCENDVKAQFALLCFATDAGTNVPESSYQDLISLLSSHEMLVRAESMKLMAQLDSKLLFNQFISSNWKRHDDDDAFYYENSHGSFALLKAASKGCINEEIVIGRILPRAYGYAAQILSKAATHEIAKRVDIAINHSLNLKINTSFPEINLNISSDNTYETKCINLSKKEDTSLNQLESIRQQAEYLKNFDKIQEGLRNSFLEFKSFIVKEGAGIVLDEFSFNGFKRLVDCNPEFGEKWYKLIIEAPRHKLTYIHNIAYFLCYALSHSSPQKSMDLLKRVSDTRPCTSITYDREKITLKLLTIWSLPSCREFDDFRFKLLDDAPNNHELSQHVLAAQKFNNVEVIKQYIIQKDSSYHPIDLCRGLMVAGFLDSNSLSDDILLKYKNDCGFIGEAQKSAQYAYERNVWACYWYNLMCETDDNEVFWAYSILFLKIVDSRFSLWEKQKEDVSTPVKLFMMNLDHKISDRYKEWEKKRIKKLFNGDIPNSFFTHNYS